MNINNGKDKDDEDAMSVTWGGVVDVGQKVIIKETLGKDPWKSGSGHEYHNNYVCVRELVNATTKKNYKVTCSIISSTLKIPLFYCDVEYDEIQQKFSAKNPTCVMRKAFDFIGIYPRRVWNGNEFFGLHRQDVKSLLATASTEMLTEVQRDISHLSFKDGSSTPWIGVVSLGDCNGKHFVCVGKKKVWTPIGYEALRKVKYEEKFVNLFCKIESNNGSELAYKCYTKEEPIVSHSSSSISKTVKCALTELNMTSTRRWSGVDFFGLTRADVLKYIDSKMEETDDSAKCKKPCSLPSVLNSVINTKHRNAGPTSKLCEKSQKQRNELIHELVEFVSSGDVKAYIQHLCQNYMDIIDDALENSDSYLRHFIETRKISTNPIQLSNLEAAELLLGRCDLSQRGYKNLKNILKKNNVHIPTYDKLQRYCNSLNVGEIYKFHDNGNSCSCMGIYTNTRETLQLIVSNKKLFKLFNFLPRERQDACFLFLKSKNPDLYANLDSSCRTILLRSTGDNFRASAKMPTEQTSFSILNVLDLSNNPYGQFVSTLWRGSESREMIEIHVKEHYDDIVNLVKSGIDLVIDDDNSEHFNVVCFLVADLCFEKDVIGQCSCNSLYGCYHCHLKNTEWNSKERKTGQPKTMIEITRNGIKALQTLGKNPNRSSAEFTKFQQSHGGQWTTNLFPAFITELMPPCGLHLILANHRYLWKFLFDVLSKRKQESDIPKALRKIGCGYLAYQIEQYEKSKKKLYDGSESLKMIGNDCKLLEENIDAFLDTFIRHDQGETWNMSTAIKLKQLLILYKSFANLARDIRTVSVDDERIKSFNTRAEKYFTTFMTSASSSALSKLPYLHYLRLHVGYLMELHSKLFGFGYGVFCCHAGEHLNKIIKTSEIQDTNLDENRFYKVVHLMRVKQLIFTDIILKKNTSIKCTACGEVGHNKKNKSCLMHPSHPPISFDESDEEM